METTALVAAIDEEIGLLTQVRELLAGGRRTAAARPARKRHHLSAEARQRIVDAQHRRWAAQKKAGK